MQVSILEPKAELVRIQVTPSYNFTSAEAFLIHSSCYLVFLDMAESELTPTQLFMLCQSLQPDREQKLRDEMELDLQGISTDIHHLQAGFMLLDCLDPYLPLIPPGSLVRSVKMDMQPSSTGSTSMLLELPVEVIVMIFGFLPPSSIIGFFCSGKQTFRYASAVLRQKPLQFYRCIATGNDIGYDPVLLLTLLPILSRHCPQLDRRWEIIEGLSLLAKHAPAGFERTSGPTVDVRSSRQSVQHRFGLGELIALIPADVDAIRVYMMEARGNSYVCGVEFVLEGSHQLLGNRSNIFNHLGALHLGGDTIRFALDSLGLWALRIGGPR